MIEYLTNLAMAFNNLTIEEIALANKILASMGDLQIVIKLTK